MKCPECSGSVQTLDTRHTKEYTRRRKICKKCQHRFSTKEVVFVFPSHVERGAMGAKQRLINRTGVTAAAEARRKLEEMRDNARIDEQ